MNRGPSAYQPNALPVGQTGSLAQSSVTSSVTSHTHTHTWQAKPSGILSDERREKERVETEIREESQRVRILVNVYLKLKKKIKDERISLVSIKVPSIC